MYEWDELKEKWERSTVTTEQAIGQLLLHGEAQHSLVVALQRRIERLEDAVARLNAAGAPPAWPPVGGRTQPPSV